MKKRRIAFILALAMCVCLSGCRQSPEGDPAHSAEESLNTPMPAGEYERAVWYGLADGSDDPERDVTQGEFDAMLTRLVELYKPEAMDIAALPDGGYPTLGGPSVDWSAFWSMGWEETDGWSEETFSQPSEAMTKAWVYDSEPMSHFHGGINFAGSRLSIGDAFSPEEILSAGPFVVTEQLDRDLTFFSQADSELPDTLPIYLMGAYAEFTDEGCLAYRTQGPLYFRCDGGNPGELYDSIEFVTPMPSVEVLSEGTVLDNLCIGFTQGSLIYHYDADNCRVQNCEVAWIGGCVTSYSFDDLEACPRGVTRFGDGINGASSYVTVQNNYIHSIIDCGIGLEMFSGDGCSPVDTRYIGNLVYHVGSGLGYMNRDENADESHMFRNCTFEDNMVLFSGLSRENSSNEACALAVDGGSNPQEGCAVRRCCRSSPATSTSSTTATLTSM